MAERTEAKARTSATVSATQQSDEPAKSGSDVSERALMRAATIGLPVATVVVALVVGVLASAGPAILVLAGGGLLGVIMLFWSSLRTLSGDAPLSPELALAMVARRARMDDLAEKKRMALRALKDLEHEHAIGKLDDHDYAELAATFRGQAKDILKQMDGAIDDERVRAEQIARAHLKKKGLLREDAAEAPLEEVEAEAPVRAPAPARRTCPKCEASNEPDATFCKACGTAIAAKEVSDAAT